VLPISVTIIAGNEEDRIADAVRSAAWADEVIVLDSESSDQTADVAAEAGARVVVEPWRGYGAQKNRAAELARNAWVFSLDADERIDPVLAVAASDLPPRPPESAFRVRRRNYMAGRPIIHWPWSWDTTVRLFDRDRARFSEVAVHESLVVTGKIGPLPGMLEHLTYRDWSDYLERQLSYSRLGAEAALARGRRPKIGDLGLRPVATFLRHLVVRGYLLGGRRGWRMSAMAARGTYLKYLLLKDLVGRSARLQS
jgi:glycosyltransferase involved in cell wall biosynthesis